MAPARGAQKLATQTLPICRMKEPTGDPNPEVEADFREVTEQLQLLLVKGKDHTRCLLQLFQ